jgi:hypothetical protein
MVPGASSRSWPFVGASRYFCLPVNETSHELVPVLLVGCFSNPILEGAVIVNGDFRYVRE